MSKAAPIRGKHRSSGNGRRRLGSVAVAALACVLMFFLDRFLMEASFEDVLLMKDIQEQLTAAIEAQGHLRHQEPQHTELVRRPDQGKYSPIICPKFLEKARSSKAPIDLDPNQGVMHGKQVDMDPKFWISLHNPQFDPARWSIMTHGNYYESALSNSIVEVLQKTTDARTRVLDVGGNIGYFSLLSAANGPVTVDAFEPNDKNQLRMCESLLLNNWHSEYDENYSGVDDVSRVNLYSLGVGRKEGTFSFQENKRNPGQGKFHENAGVPNTTALHVVTLDHFAEERGWFEESSRPNVAILKVDVEGMEYTVIEGAMKLLKANIVKNIFMEVSARTQEQRKMNQPALAMLRNAGYKLHKVGGWKGPDTEVMGLFPVQDDHHADGDGDILAEQIMMYTSKKGSKQLNLWWTIDQL